VTDYIGFIVQGLFTGIGTATGLWTYEKYIKPKLDKGHEQIEKIVYKQKRGDRKCP
jgi:hypothetical protein